jgi:hypothetical protein
MFVRLVAIFSFTRMCITLVQQVYVFEPFLSGKWSSQRAKDYCMKQMKLVLESTLILAYYREKISLLSAFPVILKAHLWWQKKSLVENCKSPFFSAFPVSAPRCLVRLRSRSSSLCANRSEINLVTAEDSTNTSWRKQVLFKSCDSVRSTPILFRYVLWCCSCRQGYHKKRSNRSQTRGHHHTDHCFVQGNRELGAE